MSLLPKIVFVGLVLKERCMILPIRPRLSFHPRGSWSSSMWIFLVPSRSKSWWEEVLLGDCWWLFKIHLGLFFKSKSETQQIFINFSIEMQCQHNVPILAIRSDNGSEFKNYTLNEFLSEEGIRHQYSANYSPQQNGVAERKNRTLMDMARSMLEEFKSPLSFWAEAISTACHSSNRLYFRKGLNKDPLWDPHRQQA